MLTATQTTILSNELTNDPLNWGYKGMIANSQFGSITETLNLAEGNHVRSGPITVEAELVMNALMLSGSWLNIETMVAPPLPQPSNPPSITDKARGASLALFRQCTSGGSLNMPNPQTANVINVQINNLLAANVITSNDVMIFTSLANGPISRGQELGLPVLTNNDIINTLGL